MFNFDFLTPTLAFPDICPLTYISSSTPYSNIQPSLRDGGPVTTCAHRGQQARRP